MCGPSQPIWVIWGARGRGAGRGPRRKRGERLARISLPLFISLSTPPCSRVQTREAGYPLRAPCSPAPVHLCLCHRGLETGQGGVQRGLRPVPDRYPPPICSLAPRWPPRPLPQSRPACGLRHRHAIDLQACGPPSSAATAVPQPPRGRAWLQGQWARSLPRPRCLAHSPASGRISAPL